MSEALTEKPGAVPLPYEAGASALRDGHYCPPPSDKDGKRWARASALVQGSRDDIYALRRDMTRLPHWQEHMRSVVSTGDKTYHCIMQTANDDAAKTMEWDMEVLADEPGKRIAWRNIGGMNGAGEVVFEDAPFGRGTIVTVLIEWHESALAAAAQTVKGNGVQHGIEANLRHFKALFETGEIPRAMPQPHGKRGITGGIKESLYGEKTPVPAGTETNA